MLKLEFLNKMKNLLGEENFSRYLEAMQKPPIRSLRFNKKKTGTKTLNSLSDTLLSPLSFHDEAYIFSYDKIGSHPYHHAGAIYVQEPSAMAPCSSIDVSPEWKVLDMCASPGGKSSQIAEKLTHGFIVSNEIVPARCKILSGNIERLGFENATVTCTDTETLKKIFPSFFDLVIADVPCSGEGMFRKDENAQNEWSPDNVVMCAHRAREILDNAAACVKKSGRIIFSTCTFSPEENEENVKFFLENHPEFRLVSPSERVCAISEDGIGFPEARRIYPHGNVGEGQFFAVFEKTDGENNSQPLFKDGTLPLYKNDEKIVKEFLDKNLLPLNGRLRVFKDNVVLLPEELPVPERITYSCGVALGRVEKNVFRPHHQLFSALGHLFRNKIDLAPDSQEIQKYLHGDTFETDAPDGWACVTVDSIALGGVKVTGKIAKNHYPKGLRNM